MANITDLDVIAFFNENVRPLADRLVGIKAPIDVGKSLFDSIVAVNSQWTGAVGTDLILDGSELDGRRTLTKAQWTTILTLIGTLKTTLETGTNMTELVKASVNPRF